MTSMRIAVSIVKIRDKAGWLPVKYSQSPGSFSILGILDTLGEALQERHGQHHITLFLDM